MTRPAEFFGYMGHFVAFYMVLYGKGEGTESSIKLNQHKI